MLNLVTTVTVEFSYFSNTNQYNTIYDLKRIEIIVHTKNVRRKVWQHWTIDSRISE